MHEASPGAGGMLPAWTRGTHSDLYKVGDPLCHAVPSHDGALSVQGVSAAVDVFLADNQHGRARKIPTRPSWPGLGAPSRALMDEALAFMESVDSGTRQSVQSEKASRTRVHNAMALGHWEADAFDSGRGAKVRRIADVALNQAQSVRDVRDSWHAPNAMSSSGGLMLRGLVGAPHAATVEALPVTSGFSQPGQSTQRKLPPFCRTSLCEASVIEIFAERPAGDRESRDPSLSRRLAERYSVTAKAVRDIWNMR